MASTALAAPPAPVAEWFRQKVSAQLQPAVKAPESGPLYREGAGRNDSVPDFVPPTSLAPLVRAVRQGVVNISTTQGAEQGGRRSLGSGFLIHPSGYVVTNSHVVGRGVDVRVRLADGREFAAAVVGRDGSTDVALLQVKGAGAEPLPWVYLGDSDALEVGDWVVAIGNPFGLDHSVSHGVISAKERVIGVGPFDDFLQMSAPINPGNSGGPLFDMRGEVVGVTTAMVAQGQGIGFAVPINLVKDLLPNLRQHGRLTRGWLGLSVREQTAGKSGALVTEVFSTGPAAKAGIRVGERLTAVNGKPIGSYGQLLRRVALLAPGTAVKLTVEGPGKAREVTVTLGARPQGTAASSVLRRMDEWGWALREQSPGPSGQRSGLFVVEVSPGGPADQAGLKAGDVVTEVNRKRVLDWSGLDAALTARTPDGGVLVRYQRGEAAQYVTLRPR